MSTPLATGRCAVCSTAAHPAALAQCADCGAWFHLELNQRKAAAGRRSCGAATFGNSCGFSFSCDPCIARAEAAAATGGPWRSAVR